MELARLGKAIEGPPARSLRRHRKRLGEGIMNHSSDESCAAVSSMLLNRVSESKFLF